MPALAGETLAWHTATSLLELEPAMAHPEHVFKGTTRKSPCSCSGNSQAPLGMWPCNLGSGSQISATHVSIQLFETLCFPDHFFVCSHGSLNVPIEHHPTIRYMVYNGYYKVMSNIPKMGHLPTPGSWRAEQHRKLSQTLVAWGNVFPGALDHGAVSGPDNALHREMAWMDRQLDDIGWCFGHRIYVHYSIYICLSSCIIYII